MRLSAAALALTLLGSPAAATEPVATLADGRSGSIAFRSQTPSGPTALLAVGAPAAIVQGELRFPEHVGGRLPAIVLHHGSGGLTRGREAAWAERLAALGFATFVVDSFGPRGVRTTSEDQSRVPTLAMVADSFAALALLATHPKIDPARVGVMGFSKGGQVALYTALEPLRRATLSDGLRFALHLAFYPSCAIPYHAPRTTTAPMVFFLGEADDYTPAHQCRPYADWFRARGSAVEMNVYAGAGHGFDVPAPVVRLARVQVANDCGLAIELEPVQGRRADGSVVAASEIDGHLRGCMRRGASFGGHPPALAVAIDDLAGVVRRVLLR